MTNRAYYLLSLIISTIMAFLCGFIGGAILPYYTIYGVLFILAGMANAMNAERAYKLWIQS